jgi:hypothetical protein
MSCYSGILHTFTDVTASENGRCDNIAEVFRKIGSNAGIVLATYVVKVTSMTGTGLDVDVALRGTVGGVPSIGIANFNTITGTGGFSMSMPVGVSPAETLKWGFSPLPHNYQLTDNSTTLDDFDAKIFCVLQRL